MGLLSRFRRGADLDQASQTLRTIPVPRINARVMVARGGRQPYPSRVEDSGLGYLMLAAPGILLEPGDPVSLTWEDGDGWFTMNTEVVETDLDSFRPTVEVSISDRVRRFADRRDGGRRRVSTPIDLTVVAAKSVREGQELRTRTTDVATDAIRFTTSAPLAPGDTLESSLHIGSQAPIRAQLRVIRVDISANSWRNTCVAAVAEILPSDRARLVAWVDEGIEVRPFDGPAAP